MKIELTRRERIMLFVGAAIVIIFVGHRFFINPLYNEYNAKQEEYSNLLFKKEEVQAKISNESVILANNSNAADTFEGIKERFKADKTSYEIDQLLTRLCQSSGLIPVTLLISEPQPFNPDIEKKSDEQSRDSVGGASVQDSGANGPTVKEWPPAFSTVTVTMGLTGSYDSMKNLISAVEAMDSVRITGLSFSERQGAVRAGELNVSVTFEITTLNEDRLLQNDTISMSKHRNSMMALHTPL